MFPGCIANPFDLLFDLSLQHHQHAHTCPVHAAVHGIREADPLLMTSLYCANVYTYVSFAQRESPFTSTTMEGH